jgi:hypothetical protein
MNFKVGNKIRICFPKNIQIIKEYKDYKIMDRITGTVIEISDYRPNILKVGIEFDIHILGHNCNGKGKNGYCRYFYDTTVKEEMKIDLLYFQHISLLKHYDIQLKLDLEE